MLRLFTRSQKSNVKLLLIVHPSWWLRSALWMLASVTNIPFWDRIVYVHQLKELHAHIDPTSLQIPQHVLLYDRATFGSSTLTAHLTADHTATHSQ